MSERFDVAIIGAGTAGLSALREVQRTTPNGVLINDGPFGTTCARVGCMPSKALIAVAKIFHQRNFLAAAGKRSDDPTPDLARCGRLGAEALE